MDLLVMRNRFVERHRANVFRALRHSATLLLIAAALVAGTFWPMLRGSWDTVIPAALGGAVAALIVFAVVVNTPLELIPLVTLYFDRDFGRGREPRGFSRALYREAALSRFESTDPLQTLQAPEWHAPQEARPVLERLLAERPADAHLAYLQATLLAAEQADAKFYFNVLSFGGGTNARVEALRRGDLGVLRSS